MRRLFIAAAAVVIAVSLCLLPAAVSAEGEDIKIVVSGVTITPKDANGVAVYPIVVNGSTYLPVRALCDAVGKSVKWDPSSRTVIIGDVPVSPQAGGSADDIPIYVDGVKLIPKDVNGNEVKPLIIDGTTYLPVRAVCEALNMRVKWEGTARTVYLDKMEEQTTKPEQQPQQEPQTPVVTQKFKTVTEIESGKEYLLKVKGRELYLTVQGDSKSDGAYIVTASDPDKDSTKWRVSSTGDGFFTLTNKNSQENLNVSGESVNPGTKIIQWPGTGGDNEKWKFEKNDDGTFSLMAKHSQLYLDSTNPQSIDQKAKGGTDAQKWEILEEIKPEVTLAPKEEEKKPEIVPVTLEGKQKAASVSAGTKYLIKLSGKELYLGVDESNEKLVLTDKVVDSRMLWEFVPCPDGSFAVKNDATALVLKIESGSDKDGAAAAVGIYSDADNSCKWKVSKNPDGTFTFFARHSYMCLEGGESGAVQKNRGASQAQKWEFLY